MKKLSKPKKPKLKLSAPKRPFKKTPERTEQKMTEALSNVPRITNDTVAEHREEVLSSARKFIYPLQHSKHRIVRTSIALLIVAIIGFFVYCGLALYKFQSTSGFTYDIVRVIPFPAAKVGGSWVSYESYLFELRRNMHYYENQQNTNFESRDGKAQLALLKRQAMNQVVQDAYVKKLADRNNVSINEPQVEQQLNLVQSQNRLGSSERALKDALNQYYGWDVNDFKRKLKQQLLQQAVVAKLDTATNQKASAASKQLAGGTDFATVATQFSDDGLTKTNGGQYPAPLTRNDSNYAPAITAEIFRLKQNQVSGIINTGYTLEILKVLDTTGNSRRAAHIQFTFKDIGDYTSPLSKSEPSHAYFKL